MEPCVKALAAGPEDRGKMPAHALPKPADEGERVVHVPGKSVPRGGLDPVEAVEVEDGVGCGKDIAGGAGMGFGLPDGRRGHGADGTGGPVPVPAGPPPFRVDNAAAVVDFAGPEDIGGAEQAGEEMRGLGCDKVAVDPLRGVMPHVGRVPCEAADEIAPVSPG